jgi:hypothetical protein
MPRSVFYSFHYKPDNWRVQKIRNIGAISGNKPCSANDWESLKKSGEQAVKNWIDQQFKGRSTAIILVGENTASRKWVKYEIKRAWELKKAVLGIHIHNLLDVNNEKADKGINPFSQFTIGDKKMSSIVKCYNPPFTASSSVYNHIAENIENWIEEAHKIRAAY